jgi:hypothetical protein
MPLEGVPCRTNTTGCAGSPAVCTRSVRPVGVVTVSWSVMPATVAGNDGSGIAHARGDRDPRYGAGA